MTTLKINGEKYEMKGVSGVIASSLFFVALLPVLLITVVYAVLVLVALLATSPICLTGIGLVKLTQRSITEMQKRPWRGTCIAPRDNNQTKSATVKLPQDKDYSIGELAKFVKENTAGDDVWVPQNGDMLLLKFKYTDSKGFPSFDYKHYSYLDGSWVEATSRDYLHLISPTEDFTYDDLRDTTSGNKTFGNLPKKYRTRG